MPPADGEAAVGGGEIVLAVAFGVLAVAGTASQPRLFLRSMLITPAIASEPYWAAAPSRSTCAFSIAIRGMPFMSVPVLPRLRAPNRFTSAEVWRRLPFTSTSVWSEPRPRSAAESTRSAPSAPVWRVELNDGEMLSASAARSKWPPCSAARHRNEVDRHRGVGGGRGADAARADDAHAWHGFSLGGVRSCGLGRGRRGEGKGSAAIQGKQHGTAQLFLFEHATSPKGKIAC